jgi:hypothetical protein
MPRTYCTPRKGLRLWRGVLQQTSVTRANVVDWVFRPGGFLVPFENFTLESTPDPKVGYAIASTQRVVRISLFNPTAGQLRTKIIVPKSQVPMGFLVIWPTQAGVTLSLLRKGFAWLVGSDGQPVKAGRTLQPHKPSTPAHNRSRMLAELFEQPFW